MRLTKVALGVALGIGGTAAVNAADVAFFPWIVVSDTVTTIVTIVDRGRATTGRYDENGRPSSNGGYLHWRMNYKQGSAPGVAPANDAPCDQVSGENGNGSYIPTTPGGITTVDLGGHFSGGEPNGVLFNDNNARDASFDDTNLIKDLSLPTRGVFFAHNSDDHVDVQTSTDDYTRDYSPDARDTPISTTGGTVQGEAMIFEFQGGAAWGYSAELKDSGNNDDATDFSYTNLSSTGMPNKPWPVVTFMPLDEVTTKLAVIPVNDWPNEGMLGRGGSGNTVNRSVSVGLRTGNPTARPGDNVGVAFDRDGEVIPGAVDVTVTCSGAVDVRNLMTAAARQSLIDGGYGLLSVISDYTAQYVNKPGHAIVYKVEYKDIEQTSDPTIRPTFNGMPMVGTFNNGMKL